MDDLGPKPHSKDLHLQEHINVFDYRRYFYHQTGIPACNGEEFTETRT